LERALDYDAPGIFNTGQGAQFTSTDFTGRLQEAGIRVSMNGRGRAVDNIFVERLWRTVKYENIYPRDYADGAAVYAGLDVYFRYYNAERWHQALDDLTPSEVYYAKAA
jgi:putative transposase